MLMAILSVLVFCVCVTSVIALVAPVLVDRGRPSVVVPVLAAGSFVCALLTGMVLSLLAVSVVGRMSLVADWGGWSADLLADNVPVPWPIGALACAVVLVLLGRSFWRTGRIAQLLFRSEKMSRRLRVSGGPIIMVNDAGADALTVAGVKGCVVISRQLFDALGHEERQIVTAHELSHLRRRHHLYVHAVDLAVAANPALGRAARSVRLGIERWADEDAAASTGDRAAAALALARTALTRASLRRTAALDQSPQRPGVFLGVTESHVTERTNALLRPAGRQLWIAIMVVVLLLFTAGAAAASTVVVHQGFETAELHTHDGCG